MPMRFLLQTEHHAELKPGREINLSADRSHYLCKVMRARREDQLECFDGHGHIIHATVLQASAKQAVVRVDTISETTAPPPVKIHVGISLLKGQAMDRAIQQATELGATQITLLSANRSNVKLSDDRADNKLAHWQKILIGACEQSGRLYLPRLQGPVRLAEFVDQLQQQDVKLIALDQGGAPLPKQLPPHSLAVLIGPEGGWDEAELGLFNSREVERLRLSNTVMRAETVPAVALALLEHVQT